MSSKLTKNENMTVMPRRCASDTMWSIVAQAGPRGEAKGFPVKKGCPSTFSYFTQLSLMPTPFGATLTTLKPRPASPLEGVGDLGVGQALRHAP